MESLLPADIKLDIFSRLPAESVLKCRQVCKTWRTLLHHPHFAQMHLQRQSVQPDNVGIIYLHGTTYHDFEMQLYYGEYDENDEHSYKKLKRINHPPAEVCETLLYSCNGLIGFSKSEFVLEDSFYICNPITREYIILPVFNNISKYKRIKHRLAYGFGYVPSTNEYKVVGIIYRRNRKKTQPSKWVGSVQVYTLGAGTGWRNKGEITNLQSWYCMDANGALYFLDDEESKIMAFDLADEEFRLLPSPPCLVRSQDDFFFIRVLGGLLCLVHEKRNESINIWSLKKNNCTTYVMKEQENQSLSWHREVGMTWEGLGAYDVDVFAFTRTGEVLLWQNLGIRSDNIKYSILLRYDPKTATLKESDMEMQFIEATAHTNSFVSLKALGEDAKIIQPAEGLLGQEKSQPY